MILRFFNTDSAPSAHVSTKLLVLVLAAFSPSLYAQEAEPAVQEVKEVSPFSGVASLSLRSSTTNSTDYDYRILLAPAINLEYALQDVVTFGLSARGTKDLNREKRATFTDLTVSASHSRELSEGFGLGVDVSYGAPVAKELYKYSNSKGTLGASLGLSYSFQGIKTDESAEAVAPSGFSINGGLGYERYLYQYQYSNGGDFLTKYSYSVSFGLAYRWDKITASASFSNISSWDMQGYKEDDSFLAVESVQYKIDDIWSVQVGHINDGNTFDYFGASSDVKIYNKRRSQVFVGTSYRF